MASACVSVRPAAVGRLNAELVVAGRCRDAGDDARRWIQRQAGRQRPVRHAPRRLTRRTKVLQRHVVCRAWRGSHELRRRNRQRDGDGRLGDAVGGIDGVDGLGDGGGRDGGAAIEGDAVIPIRIDDPQRDVGGFAGRQADGRVLNARVLDSRDSRFQRPGRTPDPGCWPRESRRAARRACSPGRPARCRSCAPAAGWRSPAGNVLFVTRLTVYDAVVLPSLVRTQVVSLIPALVRSAF